MSSRSGQLSPSGIARTFSPPPMSAHVSSLVIFGYDRELGLGFPVQRQIGVASEYLPAQAVIELYDTTFGVRSDPPPFCAIFSRDFRWAKPATTSFCSSVWPAATWPKM